VDSERELRAEFRRALDDVLPPAPWLEAAVSKDLRKERPPRSSTPSRHKLVPGSVALPRPAFQLAAGLLILVLAAVAVTAYLALRYRAPQSTPAGMDPKAYQLLVRTDYGRWSTSGDNTSCLTLQSICPAPGKPVLTATQRWLDDLNRSEPPARFAVIDAQLRRHLAAHIADLNAVFAAYRAQDQYAFDDAGNELQHQIIWLGTVAESIIYWNQGTPASYADTVRTGKTTIAACAECLSLGSASQVDCAAFQSAACEADVAYANTAIQDFLASIIRYAAPSSLSTQDAVLQRDLAGADTGVLAMANGQLFGDHAGFQAGRLQFQQALTAVNADIGRILGG
jgi:hypothetical protein